MLGKEGPETCESTAAILIRNNCPFSIWMRYLKSPHFEDTQGKETPTWFSEQLSFILSDVVAAAAIARSVQEPHLIMQKMQKNFSTSTLCKSWVLSTNFHCGCAEFEASWFRLSSARRSFALGLSEQEQIVPNRHRLTPLSPLQEPSPASYPQPRGQRVCL